MPSRLKASWRRGLLVCASLALVGLNFQAALALIVGGEGNTPVNDPGWSKGVAAIFNHTARIAYWVGPPFGGGQWTGEYRGGTAAFNAVLADFAKLDIKTKRLVIHDGVGTSFWLSTTRQGKDGEPAKKDGAKMDWSFMVWQPDSWQRRPELFMTGISPPDNGAGPPTEIDVYTGGNIDWTGVTIPEGLVIDDQRMSTHGFSPADGNVLEGKVIDLATKKPLAARIRLQRIEYKKNGGYDGYDYRYVSGTVADENGHWVLTNASAGTYQVIAEMDGYVMRIAGYPQFAEEPRWHSYDTGLSRPGPILGRVVDEAGAPLADVVVRIDAVNVEGSGRYDCANDRTQTGADGRFQIDRIPRGTTSIWIHKSGYVRPGLGEKISTPKDGIALVMKKSGRTVITVDFAALPEKPAGYSVHIEPEGGEAVGRWSGDGNINAKNQIVYEDIPPGKYVIWGRPNPGGEKDKTDPVAVELKGGETNEIKLSAKFVPPPLPDPGFKPKPTPKSSDAF